MNKQPKNVLSLQKKSSTRQFESKLSLRSFAISLPKFWFERGKFDLTKRDGKAFLTTG